jgi:hypothetical protein
LVAQPAVVVHLGEAKVFVRQDPKPLDCLVNGQATVTNLIEEVGQ